MLRDGFWFVDVPRTSSESVREELEVAFGAQHRKANPTRRDARPAVIFQDHTPAFVVRRALGAKAWSRLFSFAIVRNPWDRMVSLYLLRKELLKELPPDLSFISYMKSFESPQYLLPQSPFRHLEYYWGNSDFVTDSRGQIIVTYIARYENRAHDLKVVAARIGCPSLGQLKSNATSRSGHYSQFYDDHTRDLVGTLFARDIELFDYSFEDRR